VDQRDKELMELALSVTAQLVRDSTPEQLEDLIEGRAHLTTVPVEPPYSDLRKVR
jgi:hypothetical protein